MEHFELILSRTLQIGVGISLCLFTLALLWPNPTLQIAGIVLLIAIPCIRVILSLIQFIMMRNKRYTVITCVVLALLIWQIFKLKMIY